MPVKSCIRNCETEIILPRILVCVLWPVAVELEYRAHPQFPEYILGSDGTIWSKLYPRRRGETKRRSREQLFQLSGIVGKSGYLSISRRQDGKFSHGRIHQMMLEAFVGPRPRGKWALHRNDIRNDNRLVNLYWGTPKQNTADRVANGSPLAGESNPSVLLNAIQVREIRALKPCRGFRIAACCKYSISTSLFTKIRNRSIWKHI